MEIVLLVSCAASLQGKSHAGGLGERRVSAEKQDEADDRREMKSLFHEAVFSPKSRDLSILRPSGMIPAASYDKVRSIQEAP